MSKPHRHVGRSVEFLRNVSRQKIKRAFKHERPGKSRERLQDVLLRKEGYGIEDIANQLGRSVATIFEVVQDGPKKDSMPDTTARAQEGLSNFPVSSQS